MKVVHILLEIIKKNSNVYCRSKQNNKKLQYIYISDNKHKGWQDYHIMTQLSAQHHITRSLQITDPLSV